MLPKYYFHKDTGSMLQTSGYLDAQTADMMFDNPTFTYSSSGAVTLSTLEIQNTYKTFKHLYNGRVLKIPIMLNITVSKDKLPAGNKAFFYEVDNYDGVDLAFKCLEILKADIVKSVDKLGIVVDTIDKGATLCIIPIPGNEYSARLSGAVYIMCKADNLINEEQFNTIIGNLCNKIRNELYDNVTTIRKFLALFPRKLTLQT